MATLDLPKRQHEAHESDYLASKKARGVDPSENSNDEEEIASDLSKNDCKKEPECGSSYLSSETENEAYLQSETDVGITEYLNDLPGFTAVLKERYSDFLVNEIDLKGQVIRLTDLNEPVHETAVDGAVDVLNKTELELLENLQDSSGESEPVSIDVTDKDKEARCKIHQAIRKYFKGLDSTTELSGASKVILVRKGKSKRKAYHPSGRGNYTHFVLYKENKDTMDAISTITSFLRLSPKTLSYAGTKDKRAKTVQAVSAYRVEACKLLALNKKLNLIKIGNVVYKDSEIKLGDLMGNSFVIILRQVKGELSLINEAMLSLASKGFVNYYGMQRFGTSSVSTHRIGRSLLLGNWKEAVDLILQPRSGDKQLAVACKIWFETRDAGSALASLRYKSSIEGRLLSGLARHTECDPINALNSIPRNTRLIYIHSYQSYIWNRVVSRRIKTYGLKALPGDLLLEKDIAADEGTEESQIPKAEPQYVTDSDIQHKADLIYDIVLPLPGHSVLYPNNETKLWYEEFLKDDGMDMNSFKSNVKAYSLSGAYRKMIVKPTDVKWELMTYDDTTEPLALSDWDILLGTQLPTKIEDGKHKALKVELKLPSSSYATMAIREILKADTGVSAQKAMNLKQHI